MKLLSNIFGFFKFFSLYADPFEKDIDRFLRKNKKNARQDLLELMQKDLVKLTIFFEYKFKAYKKLKRSNRRKLYTNAALIAADFQKYLATHKKQIERKQMSLHLQDGLKRDERMTYLLGIMAYLELGGRLEYEAAATFQKLLRDPASEMLAGDCNQITTLYIYLYSLRYPVNDLQVKILPEHICLHYCGLDIETTSARLTEYCDYTFLSGVEEIVAANLLDIPDPSEKQFDVSPANLLKSAQVAYHFSGHRQTVERNLLIAYHNMAVYYAEQKDFKKASLFANKSGNTRLQSQIIRIVATENLKTKHYQKAQEGFRKINDREGEKACYQNELADLFEAIKPYKTFSDFRNRQPILRRMRELASKVNNRKVVGFVDNVLKNLK